MSQPCQNKQHELGSCACPACTRCWTSTRHPSQCSRVARAHERAAIAGCIAVVGAQRALVVVIAGNTTACVAEIAGARKRAGVIGPRAIGVAVVRVKRALVVVRARGAAARVARVAAAGE